MYLSYDRGLFFSASVFRAFSNHRELLTMAATMPGQDTPGPEHEVLDSLRLQRVQPPRTTASTQPTSIEAINTDSTADTEPNYPTGTKFWFTIIALCVTLVLGGLDANIVATAVPSITNHFHTVADVGWYSSAFRLCTCAFQFGFAKLYKLFSIKIVFVTSNLIFLIGSLLCAMAVSSTMFILGRAVTGLGFAGELAGCFAVAVQIMPLSRRPMFAGFMACVESLAIVSNPQVSFPSCRGSVYSPEVILASLAMRFLALRGTKKATTDCGTLRSQPP